MSYLCPAMKRRAFFFFLTFFISSFAAMAQRADERTIADFRQMGIPFYDGNEVKLLTTGPIKFEDMFAEIEQAKHYVHLDYFKFQEDSICGELFEILKRKAQQGVKVRIIYDGFGNHSSKLPLTKKFLKEVRAAGIEIEPS